MGYAVKHAGLDPGRLKPDEQPLCMAFDITHELGKHRGRLR